MRLSLAVLIQVTVHTSKLNGAGTDANVFVDIEGALGRSGPKELGGQMLRNLFESGRTDEFVLPLQPLGELKQLTVWHDNSGFWAGWHLDYIEVYNPASNQTVYFACDRWLCKKNDDGQIRRVLVASDIDPSTLKTTYRVTVKTSKVFGAGTDANVFIILYGQSSDTGRKFLDNKFK